MNGVTATLAASAALVGLSFLVWAPLLIWKNQPEKKARFLKGTYFLGCFLAYYVKETSPKKT